MVFIGEEKLLNGNRITGPAIFVEYSSTIVLPPSAEAVVDAYGNLIMEFTASDLSSEFGVINEGQSGSARSV